MRFLIISHTFHKKQDGLLYAYAPYVSEINLWLKNVEEVEIVAPQITGKVSNIEKAYQHNNLHFNEIPAVAFTSLKQILISLFYLPIIVFIIFKAFRKADHIHLRCPGNIGLLGCLVQVMFPKKIKTAKYAGNWDPASKQPISYKLQKWILSSTFLTKNMQTLVYGNWKNQTKNIKPFFTASFNESEIEIPIERDYSNKLNFIFVGSLVKGKRPLLAIRIVEILKEEGFNVSLELFGNGVLKPQLQSYIDDKLLQDIVTLKGNLRQKTIMQVLRKAHFLILPSKSEGWPKAIAEAMFFGTIPIATKISCVPYMLDYGKRGILIKPYTSEAVNTIKYHLKNHNDLKLMSKLGSKWSQNYTLDKFEIEIAKLLKL